MNLSLNVQLTDEQYQNLMSKSLDVLEDSEELQKAFAEGIIQGLPETIRNI